MACENPMLNPQRAYLPSCRIHHPNGEIVVVLVDDIWDREVQKLVQICGGKTGDFVKPSGPLETTSGTVSFLSPYEGSWFG
jgi:hypothetical protein